MTVNPFPASSQVLGREFRRAECCVGHVFKRAVLEVFTYTAAHKAARRCVGVLKWWRRMERTHVDRVFNRAQENLFL